MRQFPDTLLTPDPASGHALARRLAELTLNESRADDCSMAAHLSAAPVPSIESLTASYFQAVAAANGGWPR